MADRAHLALPPPRFDHLRRLTDSRGLVEHARGDVPRDDVGYCTDDVARALVLTCLAGEEQHDLARFYRDWVVDAVAEDGSCRNRLSPEGTWLDPPTLGDWWGRAIWGLGVAVAGGLASPATEEALERLIRRRSPWRRSMAYAALGAAEVARRLPGATELLADAIALVTRGDPDTRPAPGWPWPEPRLRYDNAILPLALISAAGPLDDPRPLQRGLDWLEFLVAVQQHDGHLSVAPVHGRGPGERPPGFDQQPIELGSLALAGDAAFRLTGDDRWRQLVGAAAGWFTGLNDLGLWLVDPDTGAGYDGLTPDGCNLNRGAESTLAANFSMLAAHRRGVSACPPPSASTAASDCDPTRIG